MSSYRRLSPKSDKIIREKRQEEKEEKRKRDEEKRREKREEIKKKSREISRQTYEYISKTPGMPNICLTKREMIDIMKNIPELSERDFVKKQCDILSTYNISSCPNLSSHKNFNKAYDHFLNLYKPKDRLKVLYTKNLIADEVDLIFTLQNLSPVGSKVYQTFVPTYINPLLRDILINQKNDSIAAINLTLNQGYAYGHRNLVQITRKQFNVYISIIDTECISDSMKTQIQEGFKSLYKMLQLEDLDITFYHEFDKYIENKSIKSLNETYGKQWSLDQFESELNRLCKEYRIQAGETGLFKQGFCVSWSLYFITNLYTKGYGIQSLYEDIFNMKNINKFIYIWHDNFYSYALSEIKKIEIKPWIIPPYVPDIDVPDYESEEEPDPKAASKPSRVLFLQNPEENPLRVLQESPKAAKAAPKPSK